MSKFIKIPGYNNWFNLDKILEVDIDGTYIHIFDGVSERVFEVRSKKKVKKFKNKFKKLRKCL